MRRYAVPVVVRFGVLTEISAACWPAASSAPTMAEPPVAKSLVGVIEQ